MLKKVQTDIYGFTEQIYFVYAWRSHILHPSLLHQTQIASGALLIYPNNIHFNTMLNLNCCKATKEVIKKKSSTPKKNKPFNVKHSNKIDHAIYIEIVFFCSTIPWIFTFFLAPFFLSLDYLKSFFNWNVATVFVRKFLVFDKCLLVNLIRFYFSHRYPSFDQKSCIFCNLKWWYVVQIVHIVPKR